MPRSRPRRRNANSNSQMVSMPIASANKPGRKVKLPSVPFTGTERLGSLTPTSSGTFVQSWAWNPGLSDTFSVGHFQAANFDKFKMHAKGNRIRYEPACSTLTPGTVCILIDYDPNDNAPLNLDEFTDNELAVTGPLYSRFGATIDMKQMDDCKMLVRTGPRTTDLLLTDPCTIHVAAFGYGDEAIGQVLGHFFIDYAADLYVRQPLSLSPVQPRNSYSASIVGGTIPTGTTTLQMGDTKFNTVGAELISGNTAIRLKSGAYRVHARAGCVVIQDTNLLFLSLEVHINGTRLDQSPAVYSQIPATDEQFTLQSETIFTVSDNDVVQIVLVHDAATFLSIIEDRSLVTLQLV